MADHDHAAARREITDALIAALDRRHEVLDVIVDSEHRGAAVEAVAELLGTTQLGAEAVVGMPLYELTKDSRRRTRSLLFAPRRDCDQPSWRTAAGRDAVRNFPAAPTL